MAVRAAFARRNGRQRQGQKAKAHRSIAAKNLVAKQREILDLLTPVQYEYLQTQFEEVCRRDLLAYIRTAEKFRSLRMMTQRNYQRKS